jgi:AcrR family transcriptional regulator
LPEDKRERIFNAAIKEFANNNVQSASIANIIADAGIPRGSIYQYFRDKEDIYIYVYETLRNNRAEYVKPAFDLYKKEPFFVFFEDFFIRDCEFFMLHPLHLEIGKQCYSHAKGVSHKIIQKIKGRYKEIFIIGLDYDKDRGYIRADVNCSVLADLCVHFMTDIFIFQSIYDSTSINDVRERTMAMLQIIKNGVIP